MDDICSSSVDRVATVVPPQERQAAIQRTVRTALARSHEAVAAAIAAQSAESPIDEMMEAPVGPNPVPADVVAMAASLWEALAPCPSVAFSGMPGFVSQADHERAATTAPAWRARRHSDCLETHVPPGAVSVRLAFPQRHEALLARCEEYTFAELDAGRFDRLMVAEGGQTDAPRVNLMEAGHPSAWRLQTSVVEGTDDKGHVLMLSYSSSEWWAEHWVARPMPSDTYGELRVAVWLESRGYFGDVETSGINPSCYETPPNAVNAHVYWNNPNIITSGDGAAFINDHQDQTPATSEEVNSQLANSPVLTVTSGGSEPMDFYYYYLNRKYYGGPAVRLSAFTIWIWFPADDRNFRHGCWFPTPRKEFRGYRLAFVMRWLTIRRWYQADYPHYMKMNNAEQQRQQQRAAHAAVKAATAAQSSSQAADARKRTALADCGQARTRARLDATLDPLSHEAQPMHRRVRPSPGSMRE